MIYPCFDAFLFYSDVGSLPGDDDDDLDDIDDEDDED